MFKKFALALAALLFATLVVAPPANASFNEGYFRNDSGVGYGQWFGVGLTLYPNYSGYQTVVPANGSYSNYHAGATDPEHGDITYVYIGPGVRCTVDMRNLNKPDFQGGTYGELIWRKSEVTGYVGLISMQHYMILSIWACHRV